MIICLHFGERKPGFPSSDLLIFNNPLMQTGAVLLCRCRPGRNRQMEKTTAVSEAAQTDEPAVALLAGADSESATAL